MNRMLVLGTVALCVAAPAAAQVMTPSAYVMTAGASDLFERESSQMVLESTQDPKVRAFAQMMVRDHAKSAADVKAAATRSKVRIMSPRLNAGQAEMIAQLRAETGTARDAKYVAQQKAAHNQALAVQKAYAMDGIAPALKTAAAGIVPVVEHHIEMLKTM